MGGGADDADCGDAENKLGCILSYNSHVELCVVNYTMLAVSLVAAGGLLEAERRLDPSRFGRKFVWQAAAFMAVAAFQITLCFVVNCSGVSIIWCVRFRWGGSCSQGARGALHAVRGAPGAFPASLTQAPSAPQERRRGLQLHHRPR
uniref:Uncharacterized protein n=2 Tax=Phaeomonas parva TaxID=124430 RepID=A0A7S1XX67_9STRA|mmetsp:Transcript_40747/g.127512  ORF Transcript_40747/g.127512 Transcript_40747/m.127512 type:complete len:147 (+) Transcript_40747:293-733(+)